MERPTHITGAAIGGLYIVFACVHVNRSKSFDSQSS
jgi:hypothetical protein